MLTKLHAAYQDILLVLLPDGLLFRRRDLIRTQNYIQQLVATCADDRPCKTIRPSEDQSEPGQLRHASMRHVASTRCVTWFKLFLLGMIVVTTLHVSCSPSFLHLALPW